MSDYQAPPPPPPAASAQSGLSDNAAGALAYVTVIPAIIFLLVEPYNKSSFVRFHCWQCIFLCITAFVCDAVLAVIPVIGWLLIPFVGLAILIVAIIALLKALKGERLKLPIIGNFAEKQAGV
jgi:uncharacterized membrane protein